MSDPHDPFSFDAECGDPDFVRSARDPNRPPQPGKEWERNGRATDVPVEPTDLPNPLEPEPEKPVTNGHNPVDDDFPPTDSTPLSPNRIDVNRHLGTLFPPEFVQDYPDSWIEIAFADLGGNGKPNAAEHFSAFDIAGAAEFAIRKNAAGFNIYVGPALRHGKTGANSNGRASGANFLASLYQWVDFEKPGDDTRINASLKEKNLLTTMTVVTGSTPNFRAHLYFKISGKATKDQVHDVNTALKKWLGTDDVQDPCRVMRLAGTISYPPPDKVARGYIPELVTLHIRKNMPAYTVEQLLGLTGADTGETSGPFGFNTKPGRTDDEIEALLEASREDPAPGKPGKWHNSILKAIASMIGRGWSDSAIRFACKSYCRDGYGDRDLDDLIDGARKKWNKPDTEQAAPDQTDAFAADPIDPVDLCAKFDPPTLPRGLLPAVIEAFAFDRGMTMGCDVSGIAVGALAVCAAAIPDDIGLQPKKHDTEWQEAPRLWVALVGDPSTRKTPMISAAAKPLRRIDNQMARDNQEALDAWLRLSKEDQKDEPKPKQPRAMIMDTTIEAAQEILKDR